MIIHVVQQGDTLVDIADSHNVSLMQLLRNNPHLVERESLYVGETLAISYSTIGKVITHGNTVPFIDRTTLKKTLPYLTYLSILNYTATEEGEATIGSAIDVLTNEELQNKLIENILTILRTKGYYGVNLSLEELNNTDIDLLEDFYAKITNRLYQEGYITFAIIHPNLTIERNQVSFLRLDYSLISQLSQNIIFMNFEWATSSNRASPISSYYNIIVYLNYLMQFIEPENLILGMATIGYDWELPYAPGISNVYSLTLERSVALARNVGAVIQFDIEKIPLE